MARTARSLPASCPKAGGDDRGPANYAEHPSAVARKNDAGHAQQERLLFDPRCKVVRGQRMRRLLILAVCALAAATAAEAQTQLLVYTALENGQLQP